MFGRLSGINPFFKQAGLSMVVFSQPSSNICPIETNFKRTLLIGIECVADKVRTDNSLWGDLGTKNSFPS